MGWMIGLRLSWSTPPRRIPARLARPYLVPISEVAEDDDEVEGRSAHLGETAINPGFGALEMGVFENHDHSAF